MKYHINIEYGNQTHARWNYEKEELISKFIIPFINGHVVMLQRQEGMRLVNMKSVTSIIIYKTTHNIHPKQDQWVPEEFNDPKFATNECTKEIVGEIMGNKMALPSRSLLQKALSAPEKKTFVIMKFGDPELDSVYELAIKPVVVSYGLECVRIDEIPDSGSITDQVLEHIATSKYIISDLTGERPNCYYETGFAQALGKEMILTVKHPGELHFDVQAYRFIVWKTAKELRDLLLDRFDALSKYKQPM
jgi:hypothetical protein